MSASSSASRVMRDLYALCDCGGRLSGTPGEALAAAFIMEAGAAAAGVPPIVHTVDYAGWEPLAARLFMADGEAVPCHPLVRTVPTPAGGLDAEVIDLGRGTEEEFEAHRAEIPGRIVLVRHELMFAPGTIHRRVKYERARAAGAIGFLISGPSAGSLVAGSSGREAGEGIPAAGISPETAARLRRRSGGYPRVRLAIETREMPAQTRNIFFDMPGETEEWVVLSAHYDGHSLAESAMDNASGVAIALETARRLRAGGKPARRGLRLAFFSIEEWALTGSALYVAGLDEAERAAIALNVNIDSVGFDHTLTALVSGYAALEPFLLGIAERENIGLRTYRPFQRNSDHANFAAAGIPAFRLVGGFDDANAPARHVLTAFDTRDRLDPAHMEKAAGLVTSIVAAALDAPDEQARLWRSSRES
ncbi:M28 family peptidase [Rhizobiaceae bacterium BDR2-2]|uniref:Carboxypeptidase Q n=1 Tax=Ectorhizobium quercum TaxID=2965071 RepID=A0AAE3N0M3_9HYPH|nr:M28 family peptidase [Ectorhizobium quercum]MCX8997941.1 M28 family peptidase [Ectorhizobium quercum]